ncbi:MAG: hypothetical protein NVV73_04745 [Cellvibrionaceae bacterium]|nr:hypothetical protein [Cellvibrionaceae bacterium]
MATTQILIGLDMAAAEENEVLLIIERNLVTIKADKTFDVARAAPY